MTGFLRSSFTGFYRRLIPLLLLLAQFSAHAQIPAWQSVLTAPGGNGDVKAMALDAAGNVYLAGTFYGQLAFGNTTLVDAGYGDAFVAKWSPGTNAFVWAKRVGGTGYDGVAGIALSGTAIYLTGAFESPAVEFGSTTIQNVQPPTVPFNFRSDGFVAKLVDTGTDARFGWAQQFGGAGFDAAAAVVASGNTLYLTGRHGAPAATFGSITVANGSSGTQFNTDLFVAKLIDTGSAGAFVWVQPGGGMGADYAAALALSGSSLYISGAFQNYASLGSSLLSAPGCMSGFVAKLTDNGSSASFNWSQALGGSQQFNTSTATAIAVRGSDVYTAGYFDGTGAFDNVSLVSMGSSDLFVAKLADLGNSTTLTWARRGGGSGFDGASALVPASTGIYVTGSFGSATADFGSSVLTSINPTNTASSGTPDIFLTKLTDTGSFLWALEAGGMSGDLGIALAANGPTVYVAGGVSIPATFGSLQLNGPIPFRQPFIASVSTGALATVSFGRWAGGQLYPNPAHTAITVPLPAAAAGRAQGLLTLLNSLGQVVRSQTVTLEPVSSSSQLDLANLPRGLYTLLVRAGTNTSEKLVIE